MYKDQATTGGTTNTLFMAGTPVFDVAGERTGTVSEQGVQGNFLVIHRGLLSRDVDIPLGFIQSNDVYGVYLSITKDEALNQDWQATSPQSGMAASAPGPMPWDTGPPDMIARPAVAEPMTTATPGSVVAERDTLKMPVREEELVVGKREQEIGRVRLHKDVVEEQQTITAPVTHEEVTVERVPVRGEYTPGPDAFTEKDIDIPLMGEELVVDKRASVTEEVRLHKQLVTEEQQVSDTVRKERVRVESADEAGGPGSQPGMRG